MRFTVRRLLVMVAALAFVLAPLARWFKAHMERAAIRNNVVAIASREYQKKFGTPAPPYRALPAGEAAHTSFRWDGSRQAYIVGFAHQFVVNSTRDSIGRPIPYDSGSTTFEFFSVAPNGRCNYAGMISGGDY